MKKWRVRNRGWGPRSLATGLEASNAGQPPIGAHGTRLAKVPLGANRPTDSLPLVPRPAGHSVGRPHTLD